MELDHQASNHTQEMQLILRDAATKISKFKDALDSKQQQLNDQAYTDQLTKKHETEKQKALQDLSSFKKIVSENEERLVSSYENRVSALKKQVEKMSGEFSEKIRSFESSFSELKRSSEESKAMLKQRYEDQLRDQLARSNQRYEEALNDGLKARQAMEASFAKECEELERKTREAMEQRREQELDSLRTQLTEDKLAEMTTLRRELEERMHRQRTEFDQKFEAALGELRERSEELESLRAQGLKAEEALRTEIQQLQRRLSEQAGDMDSSKRSLLAEISSAKEELLSKGAEVAAQRDEISRLTRLLSQNSVRIANLDKSLTLSLAEISDLQDRSRIFQETSKKNESELMLSISSLQREREALKSQLSLLSDDLGRSIKSGEETRQKLQDDIDRLQSELLTKDRELTSALNSTAAADEKAEMLRQLSQRELEFASERARSEEQLKEKYSSELMEVRSAMDLAQEKFHLAQAEWTVEMERLTSDKAAALSEAEENMRAIAISNEKVLSEMQQLLRNSQDEMEAQRLKSEEDILGVERELTIVKQRLSESIAGCDAIKKELEDLKKRNQYLESKLHVSQQDLINQSSSFDDQILEIQRRMQTDWNEKLKQLQESHEVAMDKSRMDHEKAVVLAIESLRKQNAEVITALNGQIENLKRDLNDALDSAESAKTQLKEQLEVMQSLNSEMDDELQRKLNKEREEMEKSHKTELGKLEEVLKAEMNRRIEILKDEFDKESADRRKRHDAEMAEVLKNNSSKIKMHLAEAKALKEDELRTLRAKLVEEREKELCRLSEDYQKSITDQRRTLDEEIDLLKRQQNEINQALAQEKISRSFTEDELNDIRMKLVDRDKEHEREIQQLTAESQKRESSLKEEYEGNAVNLRKAFKDEVSSLTADHFNEVSQLKDQLSRMLEKNGELELRWINRSSRPEDVTRIHQLEEELSDKEQSLQRTREEMMYYKREMINREENYNTKFNVSPVVGVMNVINNPGKARDKKPPKPSNPYVDPARRASMNSTLLNGAVTNVGLGSGDDTNSFNKNRAYK